MKICFLTGFPPSKAVLNEYGYHVARELQADPLISLTILSDEYNGPEPELPEFDVRRCWKQNRLSNHMRLLKASASASRTWSGSILSFPALATKRIRWPL